ncbi:unnamed protein product [Polarella glacialis]|uniref:Uncharacterized protein n=1 Tax=Polarella glacialis TaxID=89957 RepID=A0A813JPL9_POLGL|nr:unnamed protein product [Polarella glacialis]
MCLTACQSPVLMLLQLPAPRIAGSLSDHPPGSKPHHTSWTPPCARVLPPMSPSSSSWLNPELSSVVAVHHNYNTDNDNNNNKVRACPSLHAFTAPSDHVPPKPGHQFAPEDLCPTHQLENCQELLPHYRQQLGCRVETLAHRKATPSTPACLLRCYQQLQQAVAATVQTPQSLAVRISMALCSRMAKQRHEQPFQLVC